MHAVNKTCTDVQQYTYRKGSYSLKGIAMKHITDRKASKSYVQNILRFHFHSPGLRQFPLDPKTFNFCVLYISHLLVLDYKIVIFLLVLGQPTTLISIEHFVCIHANTKLQTLRQTPNIRKLLHIYYNIKNHNIIVSS